MLADKSGKPVASVVVPAYKSRGTISACLKSLLPQQTDLPYEVIVVESSGDGTADVVRECFPDVRLIESRSRLLSGAARNMGAGVSSGEILLFVDSDCVAESSWIQKMWDAHLGFDGAAVGGAVLNGNPEVPVSVASYITEFSVFFPYGQTRCMEYLCAGNVSYKADVFRRYGGFDPDQPLYVDLMFNKKLFAAGEKLLFRPDITVTHRHREGLREYLDHEVGRGRAAVAARRRGLLVGKWWVKHPALASLLIPALFLQKAVVFPCRFVRTYPSKLGSLARALPYVWIGLTFWHYGFLRGLFAASDSRPAEEGAAGCASS